jgi:hypothetical protein
MKAVAVILLCAGLAVPALAQGSLLEQGRNLLNQAPRGGAAATTTGGGAGLSAGEIGSGLKEALRIGAQRTVGRVGKADGYLKDPAIHVPLPGALERARSGLRLVGASGLLDDLEVRMNRAAEAAAPKALDIFADAIAKLSIQDAKALLQGPNDAATQHFKRTTSDPLAKAFRPIIDRSLADAGAVQALNSLKQAGGAAAGAAGGVDLTGFVLDKALEGLFHYLGQEEAAIRANPAARSTDLLRKVFG